MSTRVLSRSLLLTPVVVLLLVSPASADFVLIENFEGLELGPVDQQNGWMAISDSSAVTTDPAGSPNQVLSVITESTNLHKELLLLDGTIRMLFLRFRFGSQLNCSFGMSDWFHPTRFDHFEVELSLTNASNELRINDGGTYNILTVLQPDTWYNCWMLIDNFKNETQIWLHSRPGQSANFTDQLESEGQTVFHFRNAATDELRTFFIKTGGGSGPSGPLYIDDIYLENTNALNLNNPASEPTSVTTSELPEVYEIAPNYPNPFNPSTKIAFGLPGEQRVELIVYAMNGRRVATLVNEVMPAGRHEVVWNGCDLLGRPVASGTYIYQIKAGPFNERRRMSLVK